MAHMPRIKSPARAGLCPLLSLLLLSGCASVKTPDQVAQTFWDAMAAEDIGTARGQVTAASRASVKAPDPRVTGAVPRFGEIRIQADDAAVDTTLEFPKDDSRSPISLETHLKREKGAWKVDFDATMASLSATAPLHRLMDDLRKFADQLSEHLGGAISDLEKDLPQLEDKAKSMGEQLREQLEEFSRALEEAFKKRQQEQQRKPPEQHTI